MTMRIQCQVLQQLAILGPCTVSTLLPHLPDLTQPQVSKAINNLVFQARVFKAGETEEAGKNGKPAHIFDVNDDWEPNGKKPEKKRGRPRLTEVGRTELVRIYIPWKPKKIDLLKRILKQTGYDQDRDLLIGILSDYGEKYDGQ